MNATTHTVTSSLARVLGGRGDRNEFITAPLIYNGLIYVATGQDAEHGEGPGTLYCLDPGKHTDGSDVSSELVKKRTGHTLTRREMVAGFPKTMTRPNPKSAVVWTYQQEDVNGDGEIEFEEKFHRTIAHPAIANGLLFIADLSGVLHCIDARSGTPYWTYDEFADTWASSPLVVDGRVYVCDEDGDVAVFAVSKTRNKIAEFNMENSMYTTPAVANGVLFISNKNTLFAIQKPQPENAPTSSTIQERETDEKSPQADAVVCVVIDFLSPSRDCIHVGP